MLIAVVILKGNLCRQLRSHVRKASTSLRYPFFFSFFFFLATDVWFHTPHMCQLAHVQHKQAMGHVDPTNSGGQLTVHRRLVG